MVSWCQWLVAATDSLVLSAGCGRHESRTESPIHSEPPVKYNARESDSVVSIVAALRRTPLHMPTSEYCKWLHTRTFWQGASEILPRFPPWTVHTVATRFCHTMHCNRVFDVDAPFDRRSDAFTNSHTRIVQLKYVWRLRPSHRQWLRLLNGLRHF